MLSIIVALVVLGIIWWAVQQLLPLIPMGEPFRTIVWVLLMVLLAFFCLKVLLMFLGLMGMHTGGAAHDLFGVFH